MKTVSDPRHEFVNCRSCSSKTLFGIKVFQLFRHFSSLFPSIAGKKVLLPFLPHLTLGPRPLGGWFWLPRGRPLSSGLAKRKRSSLPYVYTRGGAHCCCKARMQPSFEGRLLLKEVRTHTDTPYTGTVYYVSIGGGHTKREGSQLSAAAAHLIC